MLSEYRNVIYGIATISVVLFHVAEDIHEKESFEHIKMLEKGLLDMALVRSPFEISDDAQCVQSHQHAINQRLMDHIDDQRVPADKVQRTDAPA